MKAKDPIWIFIYITEDHDDGTKKTATFKWCKMLLFFVSAESDRLKPHYLKCCGYTAIFCKTDLRF